MPLTVLQVVPTLGAGGAEQSCVDVAAGLVAEGHRALVVTSGGARGAEVVDAGGEVLTLPVASKNPATVLLNAYRLTRIIRANHVDIIHARSRAPAWSAFWAARRTGIPFVTTFHAVYGGFENRTKRFYNSVMTRGDAVIAISEYVRAHIVATYTVAPERLHVIPRGIDGAWFSPEAVTEDRRAALRAAWGVDPSARVILFPARLSSIKGHATMIQAFAQMADEPDVVLVMVGDDQGRTEYRESLRTLAVREGLGEGRALLAGPCADMPAAYSLATCVVAPSRVPEGFGRVPVEAMAMGIPVLASDLGGFRETLEPVAPTRLLPAEDPTTWAAALRKTLSLTQGERALEARAARAHVAARYTGSGMVAATRRVYEDLCSPKIQESCGPTA